MYKTQRLALLVIATLLQQQQQHCGLMMHLVQNGQRNSDGGLCQCLLELVDSVTRDDSGDTSASHDSLHALVDKGVLVWASVMS